MSAIDLQQALDGPRGALDGYLEARSDADIKADIRALVEHAKRPSDDRREHFAGLAMQGIASRAHLETNSMVAVAALSVQLADALIAELARVHP